MITYALKNQRYLGKAHAATIIIFMNVTQCVLTKLENFFLMFFQWFFVHLKQSMWNFFFYHTSIESVYLVINHHIKRWTMFMKAIRITDVIFVVIHFLKIVVWRIAYIQFMNATKITNSDFCVQSFSEGVYLKKHVQTVHVGQRDYKCEYCGKSYSGSGTLTKHIHCIHENRKDHKCDSCNKSFLNQGTWKHTSKQFIRPQRT